MSAFVFTTLVPVSFFKAFFTIPALNSLDKPVEIVYIRFS
jgi:hypothetical protein